MDRALQAALCPYRAAAGAASLNKGLNGDRRGWFRQK
jgi:hypothetical protein